MVATIVMAFSWSPTELGKMDLWDLRFWSEIAKQKLARSVL